MANELRPSSVLKYWYLSITRIDCHKVSREVHIQFMVERNTMDCFNCFCDFNCVFHNIKCWTETFNENIGKPTGFVGNICIFKRTSF